MSRQFIQRKHVTVSLVIILLSVQTIGTSGQRNGRNRLLKSVQTLQSTTAVPVTETRISQQQCYCMESWNCTLSRGEVYSFCGTGDSEVCCILSNQVETNNSLAKASLKPDQLIKLLKSSSKVEKISRRVPCGVSLNGGDVDSVADFKEWPWHVAILEAKGDLYICGGTFLENEDGHQLVLTAGHCVYNYAHSLKRLKVRLGEYDVSTNSEPLAHVEVLVKSIEIHPRFKNNGYLQNDIAILKLNNSIRLQNRDNIRPICLPETKLNFNFNLTKCVVTGWGRKSEHTQHSVILKEINVPIWEHKTCENKLRNMFGPNYTLSTNVICAGDQDRDACDGDGGGPMVCFDENKWIQQGIVSWGIGCGRNNPGIYTRVTSYMSWIKPLF